MKSIEKEEELIQQTAAGDREAFTTLMQAYKDYVFSICYGMLHRSEVAEELTQDVFLKVYRSIKKFKGNSAFKTWIYRITKNTVLSYLRKNRLGISTDEEILSNTIKHAIDEEVYESEEEILLKRSMEKLIPEDKMVLTMFYMEETKVKDIAEVLNLSENTIKVKLHRARKRLKKTMLNASA